MENGGQINTKTDTKQKILVFLCGLLLPVLLLEVLLRLSGFALLSYREYSNRLKLEAKGSCVVLCLGESTTYGQYPEPLEKLLNEKSGGISFKVIDEGVPGTNTTTIISRLESNIKKYNPDIIVAMMGENDGEKYSPYPEDSFFKRFKTYRLINLIAGHVSSRLWGRPEKPALPEQTAGQEQITITPQTFRDGTGTFKKELEKDPKDVEAYISLFRAYYWNGQYDKARQLADNIEKSFPDADTVRDKIAGYLRVIYPVGDRRPERYLERLAEKKVKTIAVYKSLGDIYRETGKPEKAAEVYEKGLEVLGENSWMLGSLATVYRDMGNSSRAALYTSRAEKFRESFCKTETRRNLIKLAQIASSRGIKLILMQYPLRDERPLRDILGDNGNGVVFVGNRENFRKALKTKDYWYLFRDNFAGDFGHCTEEGNGLIAENLAAAIFGERLKGGQKK